MTEEERVLEPSGKKSSRIINLILKAWSIRIIRFLVVGGINTIFGYTVYSIFILLNIHYAFASFLSTIFGIIFNFFTTGRIVFRNKNSSLIFRFFLVYGIIYLINLFALSCFDAVSFNMLIAGAIMVLPLALLSYLLHKKLVFREVEVEREEGETSN